MKYFGEGLSEKHKELSAIIRRPDHIEAAKNLFLDIHAGLHLSAVSGLLLMPPTRHVMMHLNDCCKWKTVIRKKQKFYRC